ncbi:hypothetical protein A1351_02045 [Methylosinus sp. R-45379]|nr:hypothetical protein A1351_02045 [Methylosinus sp. R-45379]
MASARGGAIRAAIAVIVAKETCMPRARSENGGRPANRDGDVAAHDLLFLGIIGASRDFDNMYLCYIMNGEASVN